MNNNENISISKLLAVLDIQDDDSFIITDVELIDENKYIHIVVLRAKCKNVANKMQKIGLKKRHFKRLLNAK